MGINNLAKEVRPSGIRPDSLDDSRLRGQRVGVDLSIDLHKSIGNDVGAYHATATPRRGGGSGRR